MTRNTSLKAYEDIQGKLGEAQLKVYLCLEDLESANNTIIAKRLGWSINRVTPRIKELRDSGFVEEDCIRMCPVTKRMTWFWRVR